PLRADRVTVEPDDPCPRDRGAYFFLDPLRADTELLDARAAARGTTVRGVRLPPAAPMTDQRPVDVVRVRDLARRTRRDISAVAAQHDRRESPAVEVEDRLDRKSTRLNSSHVAI